MSKDRSFWISEQFARKDYYCWCCGFNIRIGTWYRREVWSSLSGARKLEVARMHSSFCPVEAEQWIEEYTPPLVVTYRLTTKLAVVCYRDGTTGIETRIIAEPQIKSNEEIDSGDSLDDDSTPF